MNITSQLAGKTIESAEVFQGDNAIKMTFTDGFSFILNTKEQSANYFPPPLEVIQYYTTNNNEYKLILRLLISMGFDVCKTQLEQLSRFPYIVVFLNNKKVDGNVNLERYKNSKLTKDLDDFLDTLNLTLDSKSKTV